jgi:carbamate kinase
MRIVIALGGNALLHRGEALSAENQRTNVKIAAAALAPLALEHQLVITHGNGPQVGLLALQYSAHKEGVHYPLDILDAESEGMIGYLVEQELSNLLPAGHRCATLLTQTEVDPNDPAFQNPTKPIGPVYDRTEARRLAVQRGWSIAPDGEFFRRVVPSPRPRQILEMGVIELLVERQVTVICAGGGGRANNWRRGSDRQGLRKCAACPRAGGRRARHVDRRRGRLPGLGRSGRAGVAPSIGRGVTPA